MSGQVTLRGEDAFELAELLEFLHDWLASHGGRRIAHELNLFSGYGYSIDELRRDLARFAFLLGGDAERYLHGADR